MGNALLVQQTSANSGSTVELRSSYVRTFTYNSTLNRYQFALTVDTDLTLGIVTGAGGSGSYYVYFIPIQVGPTGSYAGWWANCTNGSNVVSATIVMSSGNCVPYWYSSSYLGSYGEFAIVYI